MLLVLSVLSACSKGITYDKEVDDLGADIVADLKASPTVSDATYQYVHGVDADQNLRFRAILKPEAVTPQSIQATMDFVAREFWQSPAKVRHMVITVYSAANPPTAENDTANRERALGTTDITDSASIDRPEMDRKYGPRPTHTR